MTKDVALQKNTEVVGLQPQSFDEMLRRAATLVKTGFLPHHIKTAEQAVAVALMGQELDIPMMLALRKIHVIQGTPGMASELMLAKARQTGQMTHFKCHDDGETATVKMRRNKEDIHIETFSMSDAREMGLVGKDNWKKQPKVMRRWRAIAASCRLLFPDALGGISHSIEELAPDIRVDDTGNPTNIEEDLVQLPDLNDAKKEGARVRDEVTKKVERETKAKSFTGALNKSQKEKLEGFMELQELVPKDMVELCVSEFGDRVRENGLTKKDYAMLQIKMDKVKSKALTVQWNPMRFVEVNKADDKADTKDEKQSIPF